MKYMVFTQKDCCEVKPSRIVTASSFSEAVAKAKAKGVRNIVDCRPFNRGVCRIPDKGLLDQGGIDTCQRR